MFVGELAFENEYLLATEMSMPAEMRARTPTPGRCRSSPRCKAV